MVSPGSHIRIVLALAVALLLTGAGCVHTTLDATAPGEYYFVSVPALPLREGEFIQRIKVQIWSGRVATLNWLPSDWDAHLSWDHPAYLEVTLHGRHFS